MSERGLGRSVERSRGLGFLRVTAPALVAVCLTPGSAWTQQPPPTPAASPSPTPSPSPKPTADSAPVVSGYGQVDYRHGDHGAAVTAPEHEVNVRRARVGVSGKIGERVAYTVTVQGDGLNVNTASFRDFYADLTFKSWVKLRAGQYKYDFDMEGRESANVMPLPDRARVTNTVAGSLTGASTAASTASDFRDRGASLLGTTTHGGARFNYAIGAFQGAGRASDNNSTFSYVLGGQVEPVHGVRLNGRFFTSDNKNQGARDKDTFSAWTAGASFDRNKVFLRAEYYDAAREKGS